MSPEIIYLLIGLVCGLIVGLAFLRSLEQSNILDGGGYVVASAVVIIATAVWPAVVCMSAIAGTLKLLHLLLKHWKVRSANR